MSRTRPLFALRTLLLLASFAALASWMSACGVDSESAGDDDSGAEANNRSNNSSNNSTGNCCENNGDANNSANNSSFGNSWSGNNTNNSDFSNNNANNNANNNQNNGGGNTNVNLGGSQDFGYFRRLLDNNIVPQRSDIDASGFFAEHHSQLPAPACGERICLQPMLGAMNNLLNGNACTILQLGLNSPIVANEQNRPPLTLAVVVDVSGSMNDAGKIDFVRDGLRKLVNELDDEDQIALITYSSDVSTLYALAPVEGNRNELQDIVDGLFAAGATNLHDGLEVGYQTVYQHYDSGRQHRVILLSDGEPTVGETDPGAILDMSRGYNSEGVGLTTVGLGTSFNFELMRGLAEQADGNYYFLEDSGAVDEVFTEELSYFTVPVAFDLVLDVEEGSHYTFNRAAGTPFWEDTETGGHLEIPSVFLAHRASHDDVTEDGGRRGGGSALLLELTPRAQADNTLSSATVAHLEFQFREPGTNRLVTETIDVDYPHNPWEVISSGFFENGVVTKSFVMFNILVALELACDSFHLEDDPFSAIALLQRVIAAAEDYEDSANDGEGDVDIQYDIELMEQFISVLVANGGAETENEEIPEDPWPAD